MSSLRSPAALIFAIACIVGTIIVLFGKVLMGAEDPTINHLYISLALIVTLGAGHFMWDAYSDGAFGWTRGVAFTVLFIVGTLLCVTLSGARSAALFEQRENEFNDAVKKQKDLTDRVSTAATGVDVARARHTTAEDDAKKYQLTADTECAGGKGTRCDGKQLSADNAAKDASRLYDRLKEAITEHARIRSELDRLVVPHEPNPELREIARLWVMIVGGDLPTVMKWLKGILPYCLALITEFGAIAFMKQAFGERKIITQHVTIGDIAHELRIPARQARKVVRTLGIARPPEGWVWKRSEADVIKAKLMSATNTVH